MKILRVPYGNQSKKIKLFFHSIFHSRCVTGITKDSVPNGRICYVIQHIDGNNRPNYNDITSFLLPLHSHLAIVLAKRTIF